MVICSPKSKYLPPDKVDCTGSLHADLGEEFQIEVRGKCVKRACGGRV